jgi:tetratricopeptide (TPR) repeat protein
VGIVIESRRPRPVPQKALKIITVFKKPPKLKSPDSNIKLTEASLSQSSAEIKADATLAKMTGQGELLPPGGASAKEIALGTSTNRPDNKRSNLPAKLTGSKIRIEKPSKWAIAGLIAMLMGLSAIWLVLFGPLAPISASLLQRQQKHAMALVILDNALMVNPKDHNLLSQRASVLQTLGKSQAALADASTLIALTDLSPGARAEAYAQRGEIYQSLSRQAESIHDLEEAGRLDKNSAGSFHRRAFYNIEYGNDPAAAVRLETLALTIDPNLPKSYLNRSCGYNQLGQYTKALEDSTKGLSLKAEWKNFPREVHPLLLNSRSLSYYGLNDLQNGIKDAQAACAETIKSAAGKDVYVTPLPFRNLAQYYLDNQQPQEAIKAIAATPHLLVDDGALLFFQKQAFEALNNPGAAKNAGPKTEGEIREAFHYFYSECFNYSRANDYQHTISAASRALQLKPENGWILRMRAQAYIGLKEYDKAIDDLTKCLAGQSSSLGLNGHLYHLRSLAERNLGQVDKAKSDEALAKHWGYQPRKQKRFRALQAL